MTSSARLASDSSGERRGVRSRTQGADHLEEIWWYCFQFQGSDARADAVIDALYATLSLLSRQPRMGRGRDWLEADQLAFASGDYLIIYRPMPGGIEVSRVSGADEALRLEH